MTQYTRKIEGSKPSEGKAPRTRRRGELEVKNPQIKQRLMDEGVPEVEVVVVASQIKQCLPLLIRGDDVAYVRLHPWTAELLARYGDKVQTIFWTTRGRVEIG
jgi:hypothetical protein